jgi:hypothetical protein
MQELLFRQEAQFGTIFMKRRPEKDREALPAETPSGPPQEPQ